RPSRDLPDDVEVRNLARGHRAERGADPRAEDRLAVVAIATLGQRGEVGRHVGGEGAARGPRGGARFEELRLRAQAPRNHRVRGGAEWELLAHALLVAVAGTADAHLRDLEIAVAPDARGDALYATLSSHSLRPCPFESVRPRIATGIA